MCMRVVCKRFWFLEYQSDIKWRPRDKNAFFGLVVGLFAGARIISCLGDTHAFDVARCACNLSHLNSMSRRSELEAKGTTRGILRYETFEF